MHADPDLMGGGSNVSLDSPDEHFVEAVDPDETPLDAVSTPPSILDGLRAQYAAADTERRLVKLILPGRFNSTLAARFSPIPFDETRRKARRMVKRGETTESELNFLAEIIAEACEEILLRPEPGGDLQPMSTLMGLASPMRFDETLRAAIGIDAPDGIDDSATVRLLFKNPEAMTAFYTELAAWLREDTADEDDEDDEPRPT